MASTGALGHRPWIARATVNVEVWCTYSRPLGYVCINPCNRCEFAETIGSDNFCGACRRRPMVYTTDFTDPFLGGHTRTCDYETPRAAYLRRRHYWDDSDEDM